MGLLAFCIGVTFLSRGSHSRHPNACLSSRISWQINLEGGLNGWTISFIIILKNGIIKDLTATVPPPPTRTHTCNVLVAPLFDKIVALLVRLPFIGGRAKMCYSGQLFVTLGGGGGGG